MMKGEEDKEAVELEVYNQGTGVEARYALRGPWPPQNFLKPQ